MKGARIIGLISVLVLVLAAAIASREQSAGTQPPGMTRNGRPARVNTVKVPGPAEHPPELLTLTEDLRALEAQGRGGVADYAAVIAKQKAQLPALRQRYAALRADGWSIHDKIDYLLLRSEMDDLEFTLTVWRPTSRDPGFYTRVALGGVARLLTGDRRFRGDPMPYSRERAQAIITALGDVAPVMAQARKNLTEIVPELADMALKYPYGAYYDQGNTLALIEKNMEQWARRTAEFFPAPEADQLRTASAAAARELRAFGEWLEQNRAKMTGRYWVGKPAMEWYTRNVLLMPYSTDQLKLMADMERARALSFMQFEMQKNRDLPQLEAPVTQKQFLDWDTETALLIRRWYLDDEQILTDRADMPDMLSEGGEYLLPFGLVSFTTERKPGISRVLIPPADHPNVAASYFGFFTDPGTIHGHEYWPGHTFEGLTHRNNPCPIRRGHRDEAHSQGWCFYHEELPALLDFPYVRGPRTRELVYVNMVIRAERITLGLKMMEGDMSATEGYEAFRRVVPTVGKAPGIVPEIAMREVYGILTRGLDHCQTGKLQIYKILGDRKMQLKDKFDLREFHDQIIGLGSVPLSLLRWEITGLDDEVKQLWETTKLATDH
ncbi:MAG: DUF885 family protein [Vicinamibacterales bacterium]